MKRLPILLTTVLLASCSTTPATAPVLISECVWTRTIRPTVAEVKIMTPDTRRQILAHNRAREKFCGSGQ